MTYEEALNNMCECCCVFPCYALKHKDHCYSYNILNEAIHKAEKYKSVVREVVSCGEIEPFEGVTE